MSDLKILPKTQKALICDKIGGELEVRQIPVPEPGPDEILVNILFSGICHSDLHIWLGEMPINLDVPVVGGHECAGVVVKIGENVKNFKVGDKAGVKWINGSCLSCDQRKSGFDQSCETTLLSGNSRNGTFQEYALIKASEAPHIPDNVDLAKISPVLCAVRTYSIPSLKRIKCKTGINCCHHRCRRWTWINGNSICKTMGMRVLALDIGVEKEKHCKKLGAEFFVDPTNEKDLVEKIVTITKGGPHGVVHVATSDQPIEYACQYIRTRGTIVLVAVPKDSKFIVDVFWAVIRAITIKGSYAGSRTDMDEAIEFFARGLIDIPIEIFALKDIPEIYKRLQNGKIHGRAVVDLSK